MSQPPPKPLRRPDRVMVYKALYNYTAQQPDELSFYEGDILYVTDTNSSTGWWTATCGASKGLIPSNYVAENTETIDFPLHEAAKRGNVSFLQECLSNKVSVNGLDKSGSTPLYWASHSGQLECVKILLSCTQPKPDLNAQNKLADTALHAAAWKGHTEVVQLLVHAGANPTLKNNERKTPLDLATNPETAAFLRRTSINNEHILADYEASDGEESD